MKAVYRFFDVRTDESNVVGLLLLHAFFNGIGISLCFTAANLLFLEHFGASKLPLAYTVSAVVLLITGFIYSRYESQVPATRFFIAVLFSCALVMGVNWLGFQWVDPTTMAFTIFVGYWIIYALTNLEFWGVAALLFNVRQSKRLFGLVGSGETMAKISGYLISPLIVSLFGTTELVLCAGLGFTISTFFIWKLVRKQPESFKEDEHHDEHHQHESMGVKAILRVLKTDRFLFWISTLAFIAIFVYFTIVYAFLGRVEASFGDNEAMATYFGLFFGVGKLLNFIFKTTMSSRLMKRFGIKTVSLLLPVILLIVNAVGIGAQFFNPAASLFLWLFGFNMLFDEIARSSLQKPAFLVLFQPLHHHRRLQGHTISKGIMEPVGMGLAGLVLLLLSRTIGLDLEVVSVYLGITVVVWLLVALKVNKEYVQILQGALKSRWLGNTKMNLDDAETRSLLHYRLESDKPLEKIYALEMLGESHIPELAKHLDELLRSELPEVQKKALQMSSSRQLHQLSHSVKRLFTCKHTDVAIEAMNAYCLLNEELVVDEMSTLLEHSDPRIQRTALANIIKHGGIYGATLHGNRLLQLLESKNPADRTLGAEIIGLIAVHNYFRPLVKLIEYPHQEVQRAAIKAAGAIGNAKVIPALLAQLGHKGLYQQLTATLEQMGDALFAHIPPHLKNDTQKQRLLLKVCSGIKTKKSRDYTFTFLHDNRVPIARQTAHALFELWFKAIQGPQKRMVIDEMTKVGEAFCTLQVIVNNGAQESFAKSAIDNEIKALQTHMLHLLALLYDRELIVKIKDTLHHHDQEGKANALERLEMLVASEVKKTVLYCFDDEERPKLQVVLCKSYGIADDPNQAIERILQQKVTTSPFLAAALLHSLPKSQHELVSDELLLNWTEAEYFLQREEAMRFIFHHRDHLVEQISLSGLFADHKVQLIQHFKEK